MPKVEIYTQPGCPYCVRALSLLQSKKIVFTEIDAPHGTAEREQAQHRSGGRSTVPQIFVDNKPIGGCTDLEQLERDGKLDKLLRGS